jgi:non-homologous end joining protein Ku
MQGKLGIGKVGLYGRGYIVAVKPKGNGLAMHTLHPLEVNRRGRGGVGG